MNYAEWKLLILTGVPVGGALVRWLLVRRQSSTTARTFWLLRFLRWLMQTVTAAVYLAQVKQVQKATNETLETTVIGYTACRAENSRLQRTNDLLQKQIELLISGVALSTPPTASDTGKPPMKRSRRVTPKSGASPRTGRNGDQNHGSSG